MSLAFETELNELVQWCWCEWICQTSIQLCSLQFKQSGWHFFSLSKAFTLSFSPDLLIWELLERKYRETLQCFSFSCCNWEMITAVLSELHDRWSHWTHSESTRKLFGIISYFYSTFRKKNKKTLLSEYACFLSISGVLKNTEEINCVSSVRPQPTAAQAYIM